VVAQLPLSRWEQASKLSHPHLSRILQCGRARLDGVSLVYVAMEFAEEELAEVDRPLTPKEAREMLTPAAKALAYLHGKGFAHGRIKPSNILSVRDELKISGDAPLRKGERHASAPEPQPYDAPELATSGVTPAADVWSLGVSLVEAMTKELPKADGGELRLPDSLKPDSFREVVAGCLERDPTRRWSVADITQWLERGAMPSLKRARPRYILPLVAAAAVVALGVAAWKYGGPYLASSSPAEPPVAASAPPQPPQQPPQPEVSVTPARPAPVKAAKLPAREIKPAPLPETEPPDVPPAPPVAAETSHAVSPDAVVFPGVAQPLLPDVPSKARSTIHGKVPIVVRVQADAGGAVTSAKIESGGSSKYFADMAVKAARQWKFVPGADGREWLLRFEFVHDAEHPVSAKVILAP
jgi:TonB family protein